METPTFDPSRFRTASNNQDQYERQLKRLSSKGNDVGSIEAAVSGALLNLSGAGRKAFVIYGEPQSGKTEMMICLTAKLLDSGRRFILHLLNDSVDLLGQNLGRFQDSGLAPSALVFNDILDPAIDINKGNFVVFCKKNAKDLEKLTDKIGQVKEIVVIDDEADYASPNAKINRDEQTKINALISELLGSTGDYIGVTATPARLDLNNTFGNDSKLWVNFPPHPMYTGQDIFFPIELLRNSGTPLQYRLTVIPDKDDNPKYARTAAFGFLISVAYLNNTQNSEKNYSILFHTSGKREDHKNDWSSIQQVFSILSDRSHSKFDTYAKEIWTLAQSRFPDTDPDKLTRYILDNISRNSLIILNSDKDFKQNGQSATRPTSLFTVIFGGNIVSRGVTFENLLAMFFTRDAKKIQQDTYIQRARMFGARGSYLSLFELTIPKQLFTDWHRCFVFHKLALAAVRSGEGSPVWLGDSRISAVANSSIDRSTVNLERGEMAFQLFDYDSQLNSGLEDCSTIREKYDFLRENLGTDAFPDYLDQFVSQTSIDFEKEVGVHPASSIQGYKDAEGLDKIAIERKRGFMGRSQLSAFSSAKHHLKIFYNGDGKGRLFYKYEGDGTMQFIKNQR